MLAGIATTGTIAAGLVAGGGARAAESAGPAQGFSPRSLERAYDVGPLLRKGIDGRGETIVIPDAPENNGLADIQTDLKAFDRRFHLPGYHLTVSRVLGYKGPLQTNGEELLDVEMVHAIAPGAKIAVLLSGDFLKPSRLGAMLRVAAGRGNIVSFSDALCAGCMTPGQRNALSGALRYARDRHVTVLASSGDDGALAAGSDTRGTSAPADNPLVTGVGGTQLAVNPNGTFAETAWTADRGRLANDAERISASGGGFSAFYRRPSFQDGLPRIGVGRGVPDVAAIADPGLATVAVSQGRVYSNPEGGTSAAAPLWAAIAALADQNAHRQLGFLNDALYRIGHSRQYRRAFHDITQGNNTVETPKGKLITGYRARPGWDAVTGWGSPDAQVLVPLLAEEVHPNDGKGL